MGRAAPFLNNARRDRVGEAQKEKEKKVGRGKWRSKDLDTPLLTHTAEDWRVPIHIGGGGERKSFWAWERQKTADFWFPRTSIPLPPTTSHWWWVDGSFHPPRSRPYLYYYWLLLLHHDQFYSPRFFFFFIIIMMIFFFFQEKNLLFPSGIKKNYFFCCLTVIKKRMVHHYYLLINEWTLLYIFLRPRKEPLWRYPVSVRGHGASWWTSSGQLKHC